MPVVLVAEVVHLFADDVGRLTDPLEHTDVFEHRRHRKPVAGALRKLREERDEAGPPGRLRGQHVTRAHGGSELGHRFRLAKGSFCSRSDCKRSIS